MRKILRESIIGLMILLNIVSVARAESISLSMSCTIPAIPGVNAPLIEQEKPQAKTDNPAQLTVSAKQETQPQTATLIQQDTKIEKETSQTENSLVMVKTFYSR